MSADSSVPPSGFDVFLQVDGIDGDSTDSSHTDWIELLSFSWGVSNQAPTLQSRSTASGKSSFSGLSVTKKLDKSSPLLMLACAGGQHIKKAVLTCRKAGGDQQDYLKITLTNILISGFVEGGHAQTPDEPTPSEQVSFNFAKIEVNYTPQTATGQIGNPVVGAATVDSADN